MSEFRREDVRGLTGASKDREWYVADKEPGGRERLVSHH